MRDALPAIPVPLAKPDPDATLDLGEVMRRVYDQADYGLRLDYAAPPPEPPLAGEDGGWLKALVRPRYA